MQCPNCEGRLLSMTVADVSIEVCRDGCGGMWFDALEIKRVDEQHEAAGIALLEASGMAPHPKRAEQRIRCPRCSDSVLMRHFWSAKYRVEIDECPTCAGIWLDVGELAQIRSLYETEEERQAAAVEYFDEVFGERLEEIRKESQARLERARRIARMFRFICPSYYIPGDQDWGAF